MSGDAYTGLKRRKQTPWSVTFGDALVSRIIAVGGIGTIAAILLVVLVLLATAWPLIGSPQVAEWVEYPTEQYEHYGVDEYALIYWGMLPNGDIEVRAIADGELISRYPRESEVDVTASQISIDRRTLVVGLSDGSVQTAGLEFEANLLNPRSLPEGVSVTEEQPVQTFEGAVYQWFDATGVRKTQLSEVQWSAPKEIADEPILAVDYLPGESANRLASNRKSHLLTMHGDQLSFSEIAEKKNMMTRKVTETVTTDSIELRQRVEDGIPLSIMLVNGTDHALVTWPNGTIDRFSIEDDTPVYRETQSGIIGGGEMTCAAPLLARQTLLCGVDDGRVLGWMVVRPELTEDETSGGSDGADADDGYRLVLAHEVQVGDSAITSIRSSEQSHLAVASDQENGASLIYVTTDTLLYRGVAELSGDINSIALDPSGSVLVAATDTSIALAQADLGHPEASYRGYFRRVWYEGHNRPKYIWQSSSGTEKSEIKLSLMPLVFGTMKGTVYAMLISVPLAILAAIYTSEFLTSAARSRVKPIIELMASLPSVVLGYVAALVAAPYLQENLGTILVALMVIPVSFIVAGNLWNLLPPARLVRLEKYRLFAMMLCLPIAYLISIPAGGVLESVWFDGNIVNWIGSGEGAATGGWMLLLIPLLALAAALVLMGPLAEWTRSTAIRRTPGSFAIFALIRLFVVCLLVLGSAWLIGLSLDAVGLDLRGSLFTSYQDRNALLVGGALGFCVIPIIYTISDDALQAVPEQLRSASLGCGATPWQTSVRVVVPAAMSGLFSAVMIGLGRAVGETMVVLMAAGNTPVMEWNPFNGFRTLSATLATELPEAAKGSTHFRTLFLAALLLFFFTLVANTLAEFVRIRFRKRASQL